MSGREREGEPSGAVAPEPVQRVREQWVSGWSSWRRFWSYQGRGRYLTVDPNGQPFRLVKTRRDGWLLNGERVKGAEVTADAVGRATAMIKAVYRPKPKKRP
ncbi:hypothetical protein ABZT26_25780 [Streptomyces sp. NPDC005395]|uniref:hypothetical protein n=1 Tax=Streptomyces sp. NPDC005395 TaxID=3157042 RepID=UPI0033A4CF8F